MHLWGNRSAFLSWLADHDGLVPCVHAGAGQPSQAGGGAPGELLGRPGAGRQGRAAQGRLQAQARAAAQHSVLSNRRQSGTGTLQECQMRLLRHSTSLGWTRAGGSNFRLAGCQCLGGLRFCLAATRCILYRMCALAGARQLVARQKSAAKCTTGRTLSTSLHPVDVDCLEWPGSTVCTVH